jgi:hypothetical protein
MRNQDDRLGEDQSLGITVIGQALSLVIRACLLYLEEGIHRKDIFDKYLNFIRFNLTAQHVKYIF